MLKLLSSLFGAVKSGAVESQMQNSSLFGRLFRSGKIHSIVKAIELFIDRIYFILVNYKNTNNLLAICFTLAIFLPVVYYFALNIRFNLSGIISAVINFLIIGILMFVSLPFVYDALQYLISPTCECVVGACV